MSENESNISRWVTFVVTPFVLLAAAWVSIKAKSWFNYDLSPAEAAAYIFGILGGITLVIYKWVHGRGNYDLAKITHEPISRIEALEELIEERLPHAPSAPVAPAAGASSKPRAPGQKPS